ncbi:putative transcription factor Hap3/NF-YB family [Rosa chinensis]|uniref:Putative transcription factor Hap3/NF-YB family n=1 Tax=Rosa chinensis TaxID=74649 RepID=A0A2P6QA94_ROSCH|nr:putative transcription factor Hap3/NF-YB family [Rosa chinensis]
MSRSIKAGLQFSVDRIAQFLKSGQYAVRVGAGAPVLEIIGFKVLELPGNAARDNKKNRIVPRCTISNQLWFFVEPPRRTIYSRM